MAWKTADSKRQRAFEVFSQVTRENQHTDIHKQPEDFLLTFGSLPIHVLNIIVSV